VARREENIVSTIKIARGVLSSMIADRDRGQAAAVIADGLNSAGVAVPRREEPMLRLRAGGFDGREDGYSLPTAPASPGRWTAQAVEAVLAAVDADPTRMVDAGATVQLDINGGT
jgi:hypothetical protein